MIDVLVSLLLTFLLVMLFCAVDPTFAEGIVRISDGPRRRVARSEVPGQAAPASVLNLI